MENKKDKEKIELDEIKYHMDLVNGWISNADNKINIAFAILSLIFSAFGVYTSTKLDVFVEGELTCLMKWFIIIASFSVLLFIVSLVFFLSALYPNLVGKHKSDDDLNLIFYEDVNQLKCKKFINKYSNMEKDEYKNFLIEEIYYNSKVCSGKMHKFSWGIIFTGFFILFVIAAFIILMFI